MAQLLRAVVELTSLEGFKIPVDVALGTWFSSEHGSGGGMAELHSLRGIFQPTVIQCNFMISRKQ